MAPRLDLHSELCALLGSNFVYFQPPATIRINYPCIIYSFTNYGVDYADNKIYSNKKEYSIILIETDPDSVLPERLLNHFSYCRFSSHYTSENLHHSAFAIYY